MWSWGTSIDELSSLDGLRPPALPAERAPAGRGRATLHVHAGAPRRARRSADEISAGPETLGGAGGALPGPGTARPPDRERHAARRPDPRHGPGRSRGRGHLLRDVLQGEGRDLCAAGLPDP